MNSEPINLISLKKLIKKKRKKEKDKTSHGRTICLVVTLKFPNQFGYY